MAKYQRLLLASARQALDEALALDPSAQLVAEAVSMLAGTPTLTAVDSAVSDPVSG